ncbi:MAG: molybdopterin-dependent oxidoreductase, partial [Spirochaetaceae bacterium]|nr:molybdopterin-dependent oxidoreductase [Spirochaetaceae bacterium]
PSHVFPQLEKDCYILQAKDILGTNRIEVLKVALPLLTSSVITYIGQALLLVLAPSLEIAEKIKSEIITSYISINQPKALKEPQVINYSFGNFDEELKKITNSKTKTEKPDNDSDDQEVKEEEEKGTLSSFTTSVIQSRRESKIDPIYKVVVEINDDIVDIYAPTQWPGLIQSCVATTCSLKKAKIIVHKEKYFSPKDEKLIAPAILASLATLGALISKKSVAIHNSCHNYHSESRIDKATWLDGEQNIIAEEVDVTIDQGAYPLFSEELTRQYLVGLMPLYKVKAFKVKFTIVSSNNPPSNFFDGLGYIEAIAASQVHNTKLGKLLAYTPFLWIEQNLKENEIQSQIINLSNINEQKTLLEKLEINSYFNRKYAAYKVNKSLKTKLSTFSSYARGIGISIAPGISGFSNYFFGLPKQSIELTLKVSGNVEINTSLYNGSKSSGIWKNIVSTSLDLKEDNIEFTEEGPDLLDSGPSVLSKNTGNMARLIKKGCEQINNKRFQQGLPIKEFVEIDRPALKQGTPYFNSNTWVASVIELRINPISLEPIVFNVSLFCSVGLISNENSYRAKLKHSVISTLDEMGAKLASANNFNIEIIIKHISNDFTDSITSGLKGTIIASFNSALNMALNEDVVILPTSSEELLHLIKDKI